MQYGCGRSSTGPSAKGEVMTYVDDQVEDAARPFEQFADQLDPATATVDDLSDLRGRRSRRPGPPRRGPGHRAGRSGAAQNLKTATRTRTASQSWMICVLPPT